MAKVGSSVPIRDPFLGREIGGKYLIEAFVGGGAMGRVYRARQLLLDKTVAVKVLHTALSADERIQGRFQREARAASRLSHPNSAQTLDFGVEDDGVLYLVMEYLEGPDLSVVIRGEGALGLERIVRVMSQVLGALAAAHDAGIIHRDLKPENILLVTRTGDDGNPVETVKVADFGIAKMVDSGTDGGAKLTDTGLVPGTPAYMAPESARGAEVDARSDIYACGVILFEMATGQLPFNAENAVAVVIKHISELPPFPSQVRPGVDPGLEQVILKCLSKSPDQRYASARELRMALRALVDPNAPTVPSGPPVALAGPVPVAVRPAPTQPDGSGGASTPDALRASGAVLRATQATELATGTRPTTGPGMGAAPAVTVTDSAPGQEPLARRTSLAVVGIGAVLSLAVVAGGLWTRSSHGHAPDPTPPAPTQVAVPARPVALEPPAPPTAPGQPAPTAEARPDPQAPLVPEAPVGTADPVASPGHHTHGHTGTAAASPAETAAHAAVPEGPPAPSPAPIAVAQTAPAPTPSPVAAPAPTVAAVPATPPPVAPPTVPPAVPAAVLRGVRGAVGALVVSAGIPTGTMRSRADRAASGLAACVGQSVQSHGGAAGFGAGGTAHVVVEVRDRRVDAVHVSGGPTGTSGCERSVRDAFEGTLPEGEDTEYAVQFNVALTGE